MSARFWDEDYQGVEIGTDVRNEWALEITKYLMQNRDADYKYVTSGNTLMIGLKHNDGPNEDDTTISIYDCVIRRRGEIY